MLEVLGRATSGNVQKVLFLLEELGAPYKRHDYGKTFEGTTLTPQYQAINPTQKVPTLRDGELHVWNRTPSCAMWPTSRKPTRCIRAIPPRAARSSAGWTGRWPRSTWPTWPASGSQAAARATERGGRQAAVRRAVAAGRAPGGPALGRGRGLLPGRHLPGAAGAPLPEIPHPKPELEHLRQWMARIEQRPAFAAAVAAG